MPCGEVFVSICNLFLPADNFEEVFPVDDLPVPVFLEDVFEVVFDAVSLELAPFEALLLPEFELELLLLLLVCVELLLFFIPLFGGVSFAFGMLSVEPVPFDMEGG